jgi:hypothetical protein
MVCIAHVFRAAALTLAIFAAACSDHPSQQTSGTSAPLADVHPYSAVITPTAPNVNNPYATDPLDPNMNPRYMRDGR